MQPPFPCPTATWHNDIYPAIDPKIPALSQEGKTVIVTGGGSGIGRATALAYAQAHAAHVYLIGRTLSTLSETADRISDSYPETKSTILTASVSDETVVHDIARKVGAWDVFVLNAAYLSAPATILKSTFEEFRTCYETNLFSIFIAAQAFLPNAKPNAAFISVNAGGSVISAAIGSGLTAYMTSKTASAKLIEYLAHEHPDVFFSSVHPGAVDTKMLRKAEKFDAGLPLDTPELSAHFMVWLSNWQDKKFLSGRMLWANWDAEELVAKADEIQKQDLFTVGQIGWPWGHVGKIGQSV